MLQQKITSELYMAEFVKKFSNFAEKAPVLLSFVKSNEGVTVIHTTSQKKYEFKWDFLVPVKTFIHEIKKVLVENHYPRIIQVIKQEVPLTPEDQAKLLEEGTPADQLPSTKEVVTQKLYRIDRVIVFRDIFILVDEETEEQYRYKMKKSCVYYLKSYRSGKFKDLVEAGEVFFRNSELLNKLEKKEKE